MLILGKRRNESSQLNSWWNPAMSPPSLNPSSPDDPAGDLRAEGFEVAEIAEQVQRSKRKVERGLQQFRDRLAALIGESTKDQ